MSCCNRQSPPQVILTSGPPSASWSLDAQGSGRLYNKLLEEPSPLSTDRKKQPSPFTELAIQISDLANRHEELFRQMLQNQSGVEEKLSLMHSTLEAVAVAQVQQQTHAEDKVSQMQSTSKAIADAQEACLGESLEFLAAPLAVDMSINQPGTQTLLHHPDSPLKPMLSAESAVQQGPEPEMPCEGIEVLPMEESTKEIRVSAASSKVDAVVENFIIEETKQAAFRESEQAAIPPLVAVGSARCSATESQATATASQVSASQAIFASKSRLSLSGPPKTDLISRLDRWLRHKEVEFAIAFAILANALLMCVECQYQGLSVGFFLQYPGREVEAHVIWPGAESAFNILDWLFGILFFLEMLLKLACWRLKYFYDPTRNRHSGKKKRLKWRYLQPVQGWNLLDFCSVLAFLIDRLTPVTAVNPQTLRLLRLFRLFRLIRLLRFVETLDHLYVMTTAIAGLNKVLTWAVVLLTLMLLTCNLCLVQILQATYFDQVTSSELTDDSLQRHHDVYKHFGTCTRCMLSMFEITLGNWPPLARLLAEEVSEWFTLVCIVHKLTIGFAVIGVITGVILQETFKVAQTDDIIMLRQKKNASRILAGKMKKLFEALDRNPDGKLECGEFMAMLQVDPDMKFWLQSLDIETDNLPTLFELIDVDRSGYITVDELVARMPRIRGAARCIDVLDILRKHFKD